MLHHVMQLEQRGAGDDRRGKQEAEARSGFAGEVAEQAAGVMVMPERETPGTTAKACSTPTVMASPRPICGSGFSNLLMRSAIHMMMATTISIDATKAGARKVVSMCFSSNAPASPAGIVAAIMNHEQLALAALFFGRQSRTSSRTSEKRTTLPPSAARMIWIHVRQKYSRMAKSVPACRATSKVRPGSLQLASRA